MIAGFMQVLPSFLKHALFDSLCNQPHRSMPSAVGNAVAKCWCVCILRIPSDMHHLGKGSVVLSQGMTGLVVVQEMFLLFWTNACTKTCQILGRRRGRCL